MLSETRLREVNTDADTRESNNLGSIRVISNCWVTSLSANWALKRRVLPVPRILPLNPFTTTNGSTTISVNEPDHGRSTSDRVRFRDANVVGGVAAATINLAAGYLITKVDDDNYTFATATTSSITESGGGGFASAGPVTVTA